jgi:SAM-dependent methyltransferase
MDTSFWDSEESVARYADMAFELWAVEADFLQKATTILGKDIKKTRLLDLGCGGGRTTVPLYKKGYQITGLDISRMLVSGLRKKFPGITVVVADAAKLPFHNHSFDIVLFSHNSLDYLYPAVQRAKALKEISRVLIPGGFFVFSSHVFNLIPYDLTILRSIVRNFFRWPKLIFRAGYYREMMGNGQCVETYATSAAEMSRELAAVGLTIIESSRNIDNSRGLKTQILKLINWERYYLARKL